MTKTKAKSSAASNAKAAPQAQSEKVVITPSLQPDHNLPKFTIRQLLEAGVHFGHKTSRRNTKMSKYLFGVRNGLSIIDLQQTGSLLNDSLKVVKQIAKNNGRILFIATKKQAAETIALTAQKCGQYYVNHRWLGGMLTNWQTVSKSIKTLKDIESQLANNELGLNKKERLVLERQRQKLEATLGGIKDMGGYPDLVFIIDTHRESLAVAEAKKIGIPVMAILDSNCNPDGITYRIPGNDDSIKSIKLYCHLLSEAILAGIRENMSGAGVNLDKVDAAKVINKGKKPAETVKSETTKAETTKAETAKAPKEDASETNSEEAVEKVAAKPAAKTAEKKAVTAKAKATEAKPAKAAPKKAPAKKTKK